MFGNRNQTGGQKKSIWKGRAACFPITGLIAGILGLALFIVGIVASSITLEKGQNDAFFDAARRNLAHTCIWPALMVIASSALAIGQARGAGTPEWRRFTLLGLAMDILVLFVLFIAWGMVGVALDQVFPGCRMCTPGDFKLRSFDTSPGHCLAMTNECYKKVSQ
uniref:MARVEL domain-containing protein n=1 Tax=Chromera velia CCMP2878 TaxID=1169474 RepID=A0A0G4GBN1_9ALVE|eukprot:Cvel_4459.t1-p1 / transcript=Cvel_4459.t1 / gene=Cvel_4459 / organism=Chromera_velia_CCMP2878 / gene_product=hypothetical protein / transcript_product=hypothetical protein / location=Cvel_scaffold195:554-2966(-) / protein_length=164 / sequence_SO=supercontig / SO=protein_coding / is_pseudo=false